MRTLLILLLGALLWPSFSSSPARTGLGPSPTSATEYFSPSEGVVLVSDHLEAMSDFPEADPGPTPAKEDLCVAPWIPQWIEDSYIPNGLASAENPVQWDPDHMIWNHTLERIELGEWYRSWPVLDTGPALDYFRGSVNAYGEIRAYPTDYDGPCSLSEF